MSIIRSRNPHGAAKCAFWGHLKTKNRSGSSIACLKWTRVILFEKQMNKP